MLAIYCHSSVMQKRKVTLFPTHHLVLTTHCTNLPLLPISKPDVTNDTVQLPIIPLCLPSPETFSILQSYLYTKRTNDLFAALLPAHPPSLSEQTTSIPESPSHSTSQQQATCISCTSLNDHQRHLKKRVRVGYLQ
jgi:hypothetical protein